MKKPRRKIPRISKLLVGVEQTLYPQVLPIPTKRFINQSGRAHLYRGERGLFRVFIGNRFQVLNRVFVNENNSNIDDTTETFQNDDVREAVIKAIAGKNIERKAALKVVLSGKRILKVEELASKELIESKEEQIKPLNYNRFDDLKKLSLNDIKEHINMVSSSKSQTEKLGNLNMAENGVWDLEKSEKEQAITNWYMLNKFESTGEEPNPIDSDRQEALENYKKLTKDERKAEIFRLRCIIQNPNIF